MNQDEERENTTKKSLQSDSNFEQLLDILEELTFILDNFEHSDEPRQLYQLVHPSDSGDPHHRVEI